MSKKETIETEPVAEQVKPKSLAVGETYLFTGKDRELLGTVKSLDPCVITSHSVRADVKVEDEMTIDPADYEISTVSREEAFARLAN